jgi:cysteine-rich repeat protein
MESRPPVKRKTRRQRASSLHHTSVMAGVGLIGCWLMSGCTFDDSAFFNETKGFECKTLDDCLGAGLINSVCIDNRCVKIEYLSNDVVADLGVSTDGEVFDPTGRVACGEATNIVFCVEGQVCCNDVCVDGQEDESNCGRCGVTCDAGEKCQLGECICGSQACDQSETCCIGDGGVPLCRPLLDDRENCGSCGNVCNTDARENCLDGQCGCIKEVATSLGPRQLVELCQEGQSCCPPPADNPTALLGCVDLNTPDNCGGCGNKCGSGEQCVDGQCTCGTVPHPSPDGLGPVCDTTDTDPGAEVVPREACCFNPNGRQECRPFADCDCSGTQCTGLQICCWNQGFNRDTCVDPTKDINNCGGCASEQNSTIEDPQFSCSPGEVCQRNFNYSVTRSPEEQNASGIFIGECKLNCSDNRAQCPGGINPDTSLPYTQDAQSCIDPLSSNEFCGAILKAGATSTTTGRCSESVPQTFGQLKNFAGVRCGSGETCRSKLLCNNPDPFPGTDNGPDGDPATVADNRPCSPRTHYYYDVAADTASFPDNQAIPPGSVFTLDDATRDVYIENLYLRAVCDTTCRAGQLRCVGGSGAPVCVDPTSNSGFCGAPLTGNCEDNTATGGTDDNGIDCNNELPNTVSAQCVTGACSNPACAPGYGDCDGDPTNGCETDVTTDPAHCGRCSTASVDASCDTGLANVAVAECQAGQCIVDCAPGFSNCQGGEVCAPTLTNCSGTENVDKLNPTGQTIRNGCETSSDTDALNCGACGNACVTATNNVTTATCNVGQCNATTCAGFVNAASPGFANCPAPVGDGDPSSCETRSNELTRCNATNLCAGPSTAATTTRIGNRAFPTNANEYIDCSNPAGFGGDVAATWACVRNAADTAYECQVSTCGPGFFACDPAQPATCFDLSTTANCSSCGNICGTGALCTSPSSGDCFCSSAAGERCRQTGPNYTSATCTGTNCILNCNPGFADCDGDAANGCEIDTNASLEHCGACNASAANPSTGTTCGTGAVCVAGGSGRVCRCSLGGSPGGGEVCDRTGTNYNGSSCDNTTGNCQLTCSPQRADCDSNVTNGCEINLTVPSDTNCGACSTNALGVSIPNSPNNCSNVPTAATSTGTRCIEFPVSSGTVRCAFCGDNRFDGTLNPALTEGCDDGNLNPGDGCSPTCTVETGFTCTTLLGSASSCTGAACGNGTLNPGETCDPAPAGSLPTATCNLDCSTSACGDGKRNPNAGANEVCDDGNTLAGDGCSPTCQQETGFTCTGAANSLSTCTGGACGNAVVNTGEVCDGGTGPAGIPPNSPRNTAGCDSDCTFPSCGDGLFNNLAGEACDAAALPTATCNTNCTVSACGDGRRNPNAGANEACDDGNTLAGDGCSPTCQQETGFTCTGLANGLSTCTGAACGNGTLNPGETCDPAPAGSLPTATCNVDCTTRVCGDGKRNTNAGANEVCDDGNTLAGDGCSPTCQQETGFTCTGPANGLSTCTGGFCGNSVVNSGEQCDTGGVNTAGCDSNCTFPACGDGLFNSAAGEACDAAALPTATCNTNCTVSACGDGRRNPNAGANEACDDGNTVAGDGCSATCQVESGFTCTSVANVLSSCSGAACNNGVVNTGEQCDGPTAGSLPTATCNLDCTTRICGDGKRNVPGGEACDDGNVLNGDGCSSACALETGSPGFTCAAPANTLTTCTGAICGNNVVNAPTEACDDGNIINSDGCVGATCQAAICGDGFVRTSGPAPTLEQCDAAALPTATCNTNCTTSVCGDGRRNPVAAANEACDDGNTNSGDGCSATCQTEVGFTCTAVANTLSSCTGGACNNGVVNAGEQCDGPTPTSLPTATCNTNCSTSACGDGRLNLVAGEQCDDRNTTSGDGCSATCQTEGGFSCTPNTNGSLSVCTITTPATVCGNGVINSGEQCDRAGAGIADDVFPSGVTCADFGFNSGSLTCRTTAPICTISTVTCTATCGNSQIEPGESCDGATLPGGLTCTLAGFSGAGTPVCLGTCKGYSRGTCGPTPSVCGNGVVETGEECDDNNPTNGDGCTACVIDAGYACVGAPSNCTLQTAFCGDGVKQPGEACDGNDFGRIGTQTISTCQHLGYPAAGTLTCNANCTMNITGCAAATCNANNSASGSEPCDNDGTNRFKSIGGTLQSCTAFGYSGGTLTCTRASGNCSLNMSACAGPNLCGNGLVNSGETCDGSNIGNATCASAGFGGTGSPGCNAGCTAFTVGTCTSPTTCGNGTIDSGEQCDGANFGGATCASLGLTGGALSCNGTCQRVTTGCTGACGNGNIDSGEQCDGANLGGVTCTSLGFTGGSVTCNGSCQRVTTGCTGQCGNGTIDSGEQCDGTNFGGATCASLGLTGGALSCNGTCQRVTTGCTGACGNGVIDTGEVCDGVNLGGKDCVDINRTEPGTPTCNGTCTTLTAGSCGPAPALCGNGVIDTGEVCDGVNLGGKDCVDINRTEPGTPTCNGTCTALTAGSCGPAPALCGNGVIDTGEVCDGVNLGGKDCVDINRTEPGTPTCNGTCTALTAGSCGPAPALCGNGVIDTGEVCDGVNLGGKDCVDINRTEPGTPTCNGTCTALTAGSCGPAPALCGNGVIDTGEVCDGVNLGGKDCVDINRTEPGTPTCNGTCTTLTAGSCGPAPATCGNGIIDAGEACDPNGSNPDVFPVGFSCITYGYPDADTLGCSAACDIVLTGCDSNACDDDGTTRETGEACDGTGFPAWPGTCADLGYASGTIGCTTGAAGTGCELNLGSCTP